MSDQKIIQWLKQCGEVPEEGFVPALRRMSKAYQKKYKIQRLDEVYFMLGTRKEYIYYWGKHTRSTQMKKKIQISGYSCCYEFI